MALKQEKQLGFFEIIELGQTIERQLIQCSNKEKNELKIYVDDESFKKIDEDMYYRQFPNGKDFVPSDDIILINFDYITIEIVKKKES